MKNKIKHITFILSLWAMFLLPSCDKNRLLDQNITLPESGWQIKDVKLFELQVADTSLPVNFYINVRHADGYPYSNLYLFIKTNFPDGKKASDTLECILADEKGQWLGDGLGDIYDNQILFKRNVRFPQSGKYTFEMQHGMRLENLPLIMDVGLRIENTAKR
jgi:gliding motility-associated lipoprotein GldH